MIGGGNRVTVGDIVRFCRETDVGIDYAVPQTFFDQMKKMGIDTKFVYSYREEDGATTWGKPVALGDMILDKLNDGSAVLMTTAECWRLRDEAAALRREVGRLRTKMGGD